MLSYLPDVADASRTAESADAGTVVVRAAGLRVRGGPTAVPAGAAPSQGELAVFCRPVVTAPAVVRRDGRVLAGGWLPDLVRLGELERHLGDGVIEELVGTAIAKGRLKDHAPVTADEESFTAVWRHAIRSMTSAQVTASSSLGALAFAADAAARAALHSLNVPARQRHSKRAQKARPKFGHTSATKKTVTGKPQVQVFAPGFS